MLQNMCIKQFRLDILKNGIFLNIRFLFHYIHLHRLTLRRRDSGDLDCLSGKRNIFFSDTIIKIICIVFLDTIFNNIILMTTPSK